MAVWHHLSAVAGVVREGIRRGRSYLNLERGMKVFFLWPYYQPYLDGFYAQRPGLELQDCDQQTRALLDDFFTWPVYPVLRLRELGHEVEVAVYNLKPAAASWSAEHGFSMPDQDWQFAVALERVRRFRPDVLWIGPMFDVFGDRLRQLKQYCRRVFTWIACPLRPGIDFGGIDCIITSHENFMRRFRDLGLVSERLLPAFETRILERVPQGAEVRDVGVSFVGSLLWAHRERIKLLRMVRRNTDLRLWIPEQRLVSKSLLRPQFYLTYLGYRDLQRQSHGPVFGLKLFEVFARSCITLNVHGSVAEGLAGNQRMFESTGTGAMLLTDGAANLAELFEPDREVVAFTSGPELIEKLLYLQDHDDARAEIAKRGQIRTLTAHSAQLRAPELEAIFRRHL
jgi:hypothetical protein